MLSHKDIKMETGRGTCMLRRWNFDSCPGSACQQGMYASWK